MVGSSLGLADKITDECASLDELDCVLWTLDFKMSCGCHVISLNFNFNR